MYCIIIFNFYTKGLNITQKIKNEIIRLKNEKNAVILAHYYVSGDVQSIADYVGDSFYLAKQAKQSKADIIVFCGVSFMGESAKILNYDKEVLMPDMSADCPMAHMVRKEKVAELRKKYDDLAVVCYINSTAELKCLSDVCVTSSNALKIIEKLPNKNIFFIPDKNLGRYIAKQLPDKNVILNDGCCPIHDKISKQQLLEEKEKHPSALIISHPECGEDVLDISDFIGSTSEIIDYAKNSTAQEFIVATEQGVQYNLEIDNPGKRFYFTNTLPICQDMKLITLEKILNVLKTEQNQVNIDERSRRKALIPLERMLELAK